MIDKLCSKKASSTGSEAIQIPSHTIYGGQIMSSIHFYMQRIFICRGLQMDSLQVYLQYHKGVIAPLYTSVKIIKNEVGCRDDTVPKTVDTRRHCEEE